MRRIEIEAWARLVLDGLREDRHLEGARVELKSQWPADHNKSARQIAGLCNAARGDEVMWLVGADEQAGQILGVTPDMSSWWPQVQSEFDGEGPSVTEVRVAISDGVTVTAILFDSELAPFVVRNANFGKPGGGRVAYEVPWREGTSVGTANRQDLVRLLVPRQTLPRIEVVKGHVAAYEDKSTGGFAWAVHLTVYVEVAMGAGLVIPNHRCSASLDIENLDYSVSEGHLSLAPGSATRGPAGRKPVHTATVHQGDEQVILDGPGFMGTHLRVDGIDDRSLAESAEPVTFTCILRPVGAEGAVPVVARGTSRPAIDPGSPLSWWVLQDASKQ